MSVLRRIQQIKNSLLSLTPSTSNANSPSPSHLHLHRMQPKHSNPTLSAGSRLYSVTANNKNDQSENEIIAKSLPNGLRVIVLNRPKALNALNLNMIRIMKDNLTVISVSLSFFLSFSFLSIYLLIYPSLSLSLSLAPSLFLFSHSNLFLLSLFNQFSLTILFLLIQSLCE
jgi:hypothetical protein